MPPTVPISTHSHTNMRPGPYQKESFNVMATAGKTEVRGSYVTVIQQVALTQFR